jgi:hypothetical protein
MGTAFVILFPLGAIIVRFLSRVLPLPVRLHYITQLFALAVVLAGAGLGIYLSRYIQFKYARTPPPPGSTPANVDQIFGIIIIGLLVLQALLGVYHHRNYVKYHPQSRRWFTLAHMWLGRTLIVCGLANAGAGLNLAGVKWAWVAVWWACTAALAGVYAGVSIVKWWFGRRNKRAGYI